MGDKYMLDRVGTDTEIFLRSIETNQPIPVIGLIGGTKHHPKPIRELGKGFCVQEDNVMLEYNIPAAKTKEEFVNNVMKMNSYLQELLQKKGLKADICSSMAFTPTQLRHPQAQEIGCEPDWNVWTRSINPSPKENSLMNKIRTSGGHVHVSFSINGKKMTNIEIDDVFAKEPVVKALDIMNSIPSLMWDTDRPRLKLYGKPGAFRNKNYGIEHRTLSNWWTRSPKEIAWVFEGVEKAFYVLNHEGIRVIESIQPYIHEAFAVINTRSKEAEEYIRLICTMFGIMDRLPQGTVPYPGKVTQFDYSEMKRK